MALTIVTNPVTTIATTTATCGGNTISGTGTITAKGVCYKTSSTPVSPTISDTILVASGTTTSDFTSNLTGLTSGLTYYIRAYVTTGGITSYGATVVFTTLGLTTVDPDAATPAITSTTATSGATNISGFNLGNISASGVCWSTSTSPTLGVGNYTQNSIIGNTFISNITGLIANTTYYVRSYITVTGSPSITHYGTEVSFTTSTNDPTVTTNSSITSITGTGATVSGNVVSTGGATVSERGIQYSLIPNMSSGITSVTSGSGTGTFSATLTGLTPATTYYVRAYGTNTHGTGYGAIYNFTALGGPVVETIIPYSITSSTAQVGCNILNQGSSSLIARGIVISTSPDPTLYTGTTYTDAYPGNGTQYLTKLTSLTKDTTYYIKAYATNTQGTSYGEELIFSTTSCNPLVEDCNPQEYPVVECSDVACEYIIPLACVTGEVGSTQCDFVTPEDPTLLGSLIKINELLCLLSSKDFIIFYLSTISNNTVLKTIFCDAINRCGEVTATVQSSNGSVNLFISAIDPGYTIIGRTIICSTLGKFTAGTTLVSTTVPINGESGNYVMSLPAISAYNGSVTLTFI